MRNISIPTRAKHLKITKEWNNIVNSILSNQVTIISTPTGSGKSMLVPYIANKISGKQVYCTVPRVVISKENTKGSNALIFDNYDFGAGYMTGRGGDSDNAKTASVVYISEGSFLSRGLYESLSLGSILVIDEVHEMGINLMAVMSCTFDLLDKGIKVVLMSATCDTKDFEKYYDGYSVNSIIMEESERQFPVNELIVDNPIRSIYDAYSQGGRVLVGLEGKPEIESFISNIKLIDKTAVVYPFHGELEVEEEERALTHKGAMILVATNILQSSVTIDGLTHLYVSGVGKRIEKVGGMTKLVPYNLSKAEMRQWYGRLGRVCEGIVLLTEGEKESYQYRDSMPIPDILRLPLEQACLAFAQVKQDIREAKLFKSPTKSELERAFIVLEKSKLIDGNELTDLGRKVVQEQSDFRTSIIAIKCKEKGIEAIGKKIQIILSVGHPFRKATKGVFNKVLTGAVSYSCYLQWIGAIDGIIELYGYKVQQYEYEQFKEFCEREGLFRKSLEKIMRQFERVDKQLITPDLNKSYPLFIECLKEAYLDYPHGVIDGVPDGSGFVNRPDTEFGYSFGNFGEIKQVNRTIFSHLNYFVYKY